MPGLPYLRKLSLDDFKISFILFFRVLKYGNISQKSWKLNTTTFSFQAFCALEKPAAGYVSQRESESSRLVGCCSGDKFLSLGESSCPSSPFCTRHDLLSGQYSPDGHTHGLVVESTWQWAVTFYLQRGTSTQTSLPSFDPGNGFDPSLQRQDLSNQLPDHVDSFTAVLWMDLSSCKLQNF